MLTPTLICGLMAGVILGPPATPCETGKLISLSPAGSNAMGTRVAIGGDVAVAGAEFTSVGGLFSGSVDVFRRHGATWRQEQHIRAFDASGSDFYGAAVDIDGDVLAVGAWGDDDGGNGSGSVYVYRFDGELWQLEQKLGASDAAAADGFGQGLSLRVTDTREILLIGAPGDDDNGTRSGSVYAFENIDGTWMQRDKVIASNGGSPDEFGFSIDLNTSGTEAVVGAWLHDTNGLNFAGAAYVIEEVADGDWAETEKIATQFPGLEDRFGGNVAMYGDVIVIGADRDDDGGQTSGSAHIFERDGNDWIEVTKIQGSDTGTNDHFGQNVAATPKHVIVGAPLHNNNRGGVYIFEKIPTPGPGGDEVWTEIAAIDAFDAAFNDQFGIAVDARDDVMIIGAPNEDDGASNGGAIYTLAGLTDLDCDRSGGHDTCEIIAGLTADCDDDGTPDMCQLGEDDRNRNGVLDTCESGGDLNGDGTIGPPDLALLFDHWGPCPVGTTICTGDLNGDGAVNATDLAALLIAWD